MELGGASQGLPMVSIGMPIYSGERYIREALDSLLAQTFTDFELIISDNASSDRTESICREYAERDARIIYFRQEENIGAAGNFQFVLDRAQSDLFMWAAHDDVWAKNYLKDATALLADKGIDFICPTFSVRSIYLNFGKKFNENIFKFIESSDRKLRVLNFLALHHDSHKCNIVYSLFRTDFLKTVIKIQDIGNDGALGAAILGSGRGKLLSGALFSKRYPMLWPGALSMPFAWLYKNSSKEFDLAKESGLKRLHVLFPEYFDEIKAIFYRYQAYTHEKCYRICSIDNDLGKQAGKK